MAVGDSEVRDKYKESELLDQYIQKKKALDNYISFQRNQNNPLSFPNEDMLDQFPPK